MGDRVKEMVWSSREGRTIYTRIRKGEMLCWQVAKETWREGEGEREVEQNKREVCRVAR